MGSFGSVIVNELVPGLRHAPLQRVSIEQVGVDAYGGFGKFCLRAEIEPALQPQTRGRLAADTLGEGALALGIGARVEAACRSRQRGGADEGGVGLGEQADMDVV